MHGSDFVDGVSKDTQTGFVDRIDLEEWCGFLQMCRALLDRPEAGLHGCRCTHHTPPAPDARDEAVRVLDGWLGTST